MRCLMLILTFCLVGTGRATGTSSADSLFSVANEAFDDGRYTFAAQTYREILDAGLSSSELDFNLGLTLLRLGRDGEALFHFTKAQREPTVSAHAENQIRLTRERLMLAPESDHDLAPLIDPVWIWAVGIIMLSSGVIAYVRPGGSSSLPRLLTVAGLVLTLTAPVISVAASRHGHAMVTRGPAMIYDTFDSLAPSSATVRDGQSLRLHHEQGARVEVTTPDGRRGWVDRHRVSEF